MSKGGGGGNTTTVQKADPWSGQQPYLNQAFQSASNLFYGDAGLGYGIYHPQYFDANTAGAPASLNASGTVAGFTPMQQSGIETMLDASGMNSTILNGLMNGASPLGQFGFANAHNPGNSIYGQVSDTAMSNPGNGALSGTGALAGGATGNNALTQYASGQMLGTENPAWQELSKSVAASTVPQLEGQFTQGGAMNNPNAHYEIANGLASALAPYAEQNYNTQTQNQLNAANTLSGNALGAVGQLSSNFNTGLQNLLGSAQGISGNYNTGNQQTIQNEIAAPGLSAAYMQNAHTPFDVGTVQQGQNQAQLSDMVNHWNYNQNLPLNLLNAYDSAISGNYGGTSTLTQPYFTNPMANALGTGAGMLGLYNMGSQAGLWGGLGGLFGGGGAAAGAGSAGLGDLIGTMAMLA